MPSTSKTLQRIAPMMAARTTSTSPSLRAKMPIISSVALPKVAKSRPPNASPVCSAIRSTDCPTRAARGIIPRLASTKSSRGGTGKYAKRMARPENRSKQYNQRGIDTSCVLLLIPCMEIIRWLLAYQKHREKATVHWTSASFVSPEQTRFKQE